MKKTSKTQPRLTDWIPSNVKPTLPGWYQRCYKGFDSHQDLQNPDWWDGETWRYGNKAKLECIKQDRKWRGLAEDPSKAVAPC